MDKQREEFDEIEQYIKGYTPSEIEQQLILTCVNEMVEQNLLQPTKVKPWTPYLKGCADGVKGHYCVARYNPGGNFHEYWTGSKWASAGKVYQFQESDNGNT